MPQPSPGISWPIIAPGNRRTAVDPAAGPALHAPFARARSSGVEHLTFNQRVDGSKPSGLAKSRNHQMVSGPRLKGGRVFAGRSHVIVQLNIQTACAYPLSQPRIA